MRTYALVLSIVAALTACKEKNANVSSSEQAYVEKEVASLEAALAKGNETGVLIECMATITFPVQCGNHDARHSD